MSDTKFTPGSWEVRKEIDGLHEGWKTWVCSGKRGVAVCNNQTRGSTFNAGRSEAEANAHLIAAAKDMFFLLEAACCPQCDGSGACHDNYGEMCQCQWCDERSAALAKARGES